MPIYSFEGKAPHIDAEAFIAPTATIVGDVTVEAGASVWYNAVVRADYSPVVIRAGANVQDGAVVHGPPNEPVDIGAGATVAHLVVVHGAVIGQEAMIANGATVLDGARIGRRVMVAAHSLVPAGMEVPDEVLVAGAPAEIKKPIAGTPAEFWISMNPPAYAALAAQHRVGIAEIP